ARGRAQPAHPAAETRRAAAADEHRAGGAQRAVRPALAAVRQVLRPEPRTDAGGAVLGAARAAPQPARQPRRRGRLPGAGQAVLRVVLAGRDGPALARRRNTERGAGLLARRGDPAGAGGVGVEPGARTEPRPGRGPRPAGELVQAGARTERAGPR